MATLDSFNPQRADMLGRYMALHSRKKRLCHKSIRNSTPSPPLSPLPSIVHHASPEMSTSLISEDTSSSSASPSPTLGAQHHHQQSQHHHVFSPLFPPAYPTATTIPRKSSSGSSSSRSPGSIAPIPEDDSLDDFASHERAEIQLADVNHEIKTTLTEMLNCESVRNDGKMRLWIQTKLMDAEMELRRQRRSSTRRRSSAPRIVLTPTDDDDSDDVRRQSA